MKIAAIALNTWRETMRDRLIGVVLIFLFATTGLAFAFEAHSPDAARALPDLALTLMGILGALVAVFLGTSLVHKELDRRTIYIVLAKPIDRMQFLVGKYLGLMATLTLMTVIMGVLLCGLMLLVGHFTPAVLALLLSLWMELSLLTAMAFCFSTITSGVLSALYTGGLFLLGQQTLMLRQFGDTEVHHHWYNYALGRVMYYLLPNFQVFDFKNTLLYGGQIAWGGWAYGLLYGALLSVALLLVAGQAWEGRELP